jgi:alanine racemase
MAFDFFSSQPSPTEIAERVEGYSSWFEVDLDAIGSNLNRIREQAGVEVIPCVKNNAYGHGLIPVVSHLERSRVKRVLVAKLWEVLKLRGAGLTCEIINMDPLFTEEQFERVVNLGITQTVFNIVVAKRLDKAAERLGKTAHIFVKVDTGLKRIGVKHNDAADLIERISKLPNIRIDGIFSTFIQNEDQDSIQLAKLNEVVAELEQRGIDPGIRSIASSDAVLHNPEAYLDAVRPGMILYGVPPSEADSEAVAQFQQALCFKARLELVKEIDKGDSVTYWGRYTAPRRMKVGTLHVGFYDGLPRELANKGRVRVGDVFRSFLGSVSLNHVVIDLRGTEAKVGDVVEVIGRSGKNTVSNTARLANWMTYSLLNHLNPMTPRIYYEKGTPIAITEPTSKNPLGMTIKYLQP